MTARDRDRDDELLLLVGRINGNVETLLKQGDGHAERITELETWKNRAIGMALGAGGIAGGVVAKLATFLSSTTAHP